MATVVDDRRFVIEQFEYLYGRKPTLTELEFHVGRLQGGMTRSHWVSIRERYGTQDAVVRLFKQVFGADPSAKQIATYSAMLTNGTTTRKQLLERFNASPHALLREPSTPDDPTDQDALSYLKGVLDSYGLGSLGDWAWEQIQQGHSADRIIQNLRETTEYKQRFKGLEERRAAGLPAISEGEYIAYERDVRQMMRAAGLPPDFYDSPDDFATFIGQDVSAAEMQARISEGYLAASQAPPEVRQQLQELYGITEGQLAAFFLDPDRALPVIQRQFTAAQLSGAAQRTGYGALNATEAEGLATLGITDREAEQGFGALVDSRELFGTLPGEQAQEINRQTQQAAVFGGDANARQQIQRRAQSRVSQGSGAQSFAIGQGGIAGLEA